ncbi:MAG: hypothetical protein HY778_01655 [Betaproteobacteria bacterium]|nr:hypothetical protein [Betaproteobacteria bacterium]
MTVHVPAAPAEVMAFCRDLGRLLRLNPHLEIRAWEEGAGPFLPGRTWRLHVLNEMTGIERELELRLEATDAAGFRVALSPGAKRALAVSVAPHAGPGGGSALTLREFYDSAAGTGQLEREVDRSLAPWGVAIRRHLCGMRRWGRLPFYRRLRGGWLGMRPRERRIGRLIAWTSVLEFVVFLFVLAIFWAESRG